SCTGASPALNAGAPGTTGERPDCQPIDQRSVSRPQGARCDIGAFEVAAVGAFLVDPEDPTVKANDVLLLRFTWTHPGVWRDLDTLELRVVDEAGQPIIWVRWDETTNLLSLFDDK